MVKPLEKLLLCPKEWSILLCNIKILESRLSLLFLAMKFSCILFFACIFCTKLSAQDCAKAWMYWEQRTALSEQTWSTYQLKVPIDKIQIDTAKKIGADYMLVIQSLFDQKFLNDIDDFIAYGHKQGLNVLLEVHTKEEFQNALKTEADIIGINNRNLKTMKVDINTSLTLKKYIDPNKIVVAESGLKNNADLLLFKKNNIHNFLIGESLMKEQNLTLATKKLLGLSN